MWCSRAGQYAACLFKLNLDIAKIHKYVPRVT